MNSVNNYPPRPYTVGYETNQKPAPIRYSESAEAQAGASADSDSLPARPRGAVERQGQFSAQNRIANSDSSQAPATHDSVQLAQLVRQNDQLRAQFQQLNNQMTQLVQQLQREVAELIEKYEGPPRQDSESSTPGSQAVPGNVASHTSSVAQAPTAREQTQAPASETQVTLDQLAASNAQLTQAIQQLIDQLRTAFGAIQNTLERLSEMASAPSTSQQPATRNESPDDAGLSGDVSPPASRTFEDVSRENQQLEHQIRQLNEQIPKVVDKLRAQIKSLS